MKMFSSTPKIMKFGIWGPRGSGKTAYIVMLRYSAPNNWEVRPFSEGGGDLFAKGRQLMRDDHTFLPQTPMGYPKMLHLEMQGPGKLFGDRRMRIHIPEASGELFANPDSDEAKPLIDQLSRFHGLLWLIDPEKINNRYESYDDPKSYLTLIDEWLIRINDAQGGGKVKMHIAFCLTKMDLPVHSDHFDNPAKYCFELLGDDLYVILKNSCDPQRVKFFSTSAIGFLPGTKNTSNRDPNDPQKLLSPANPINLFAPFEWLFTEI